MADHVIVEVRLTGLLHIDKLVFSMFFVLVLLLGIDLKTCEIHK